ncbi:hypothetical protein EVAR_41437_1 [Eumeta japonica]|uniref:Uncharacterized protein n=1 Tax=Eumeta variegata TaxID=151549 RepID=A0A4C1W7D2_EUMVA|nr:hypothetical protein EVAR_41437_1 [Eumeta japonica]
MQSEERQRSYYYVKSHTDPDRGASFLCLLGTSAVNAARLMQSLWYQSRSSRASYGDDAISYVQLKRDAHLCTVKCKMCPEHKVHAKLYGCTLIIDEEDDVIVSVVCEDCVASRALIEKVKEETIEQSKSNLWFELRYGRITASKAYEVSRCKTADGTLVSLILGGKIPETKHMKRGRVLEDQVRRTVEDMLKKLPSAVLY